MMDLAVDDYVTSGTGTLDEGHGARIQPWGRYVRGQP